jgi:hypothetical protein
MQRFESQNSGGWEANPDKTGYEATLELHFWDALREKDPVKSRLLLQELYVAALNDGMPRDVIDGIYSTAHTAIGLEGNRLATEDS